MSSSHTTPESYIDPRHLFNHTRGSIPGTEQSIPRFFRPEMTSPYFSSVTMSNMASDMASPFNGTPSEIDEGGQFCDNTFDTFLGNSMSELEDEAFRAFSPSLSPPDSFSSGTRPGPPTFLDTRLQESLTLVSRAAPTSAPQNFTRHHHTPSLPILHPIVPSTLPSQWSRSLSIPAGPVKQNLSLTTNLGTVGGSENQNSIQGSPHLTITPWEKEERDLIIGSGSEDETQSPTDMTSFSGDCQRQFDTGTITQSSASHWVERQDREVYEDCRSRKGVTPDHRSLMIQSEIPNFKDLRISEEMEAKKQEVEDWKSQLGSGSDTEDEVPMGAQSTLNIFGPQRPRAKSTGSACTPRPAVLQSRSNPGFRFKNVDCLPQQPRDPEERTLVQSHNEDDTDTMSLHENRLQDGQSYFNLKARHITGRDITSIMRPAPFRDPIAYHKITRPDSPSQRTQPETANAAMHRFNRSADNLSLLSRTATWGTRRRSEPSVADIESIRSGRVGHGVGLIKRFSIEQEKKEKKPSISLIQEGIQRVSSIVRRNSHSRPKRGRIDSQELAQKDSPFGGRALPTLVVAAKAESLSLESATGPARPHRSSSSVGGTISGRNVFGKVSDRLRRVRSKSELPRSPEQDGLYGMIKAAGGPPAPIPSLPAQTASQEHLSVDGNIINVDDDVDDVDEDEDDEEILAHKVSSVDQAPIEPTWLGFRDHVRRLNPNMKEANQYLVDRIAQHQVNRYQSLTILRNKHHDSVAQGGCTSGAKCQGLEMKSTIESNTSLVESACRDTPDHGIPLQTALSPGIFPARIPMPPTRSFPNEFECQICFKAKMFKKPSEWTKHVHEDVQPFSCTYADCKESRTFKRKADWVRHEKEIHRHTEWWLCDIDNCGHKCHRRDNFKEHLVREHKLDEPKQRANWADKRSSEPEEEIWAIVRKCHGEDKTIPTEEPCKFCGSVEKTWKSLGVHLAKHMEEISLPLIRLIEQQSTNAGLMADPAGSLPALIPTTPTKMDRQPDLFQHSIRSQGPNRSNARSSPYVKFNPSVSPLTRQNLPIYNKVPSSRNPHDPNQIFRKRVSSPGNDFQLSTCGDQSYKISEQPQDSFQASNYTMAPLPQQHPYTSIEKSPMIAQDLELNPSPMMFPDTNFQGTILENYSTTPNLRFYNQQPIHDSPQQFLQPQPHPYPQEYRDQNRNQIQSYYTSGTPLDFVNSVQYSHSPATRPIDPITDHYALSNVDMNMNTNIGMNNLFNS